MGNCVSCSNMAGKGSSTENARKPSTYIEGGHSFSFIREMIENGTAWLGEPRGGKEIVQSAGSELGRATESVPLTGEGAVQFVGGYRRPTESFLAVPRISHKLGRSSSLPNLPIPRHSTVASLEAPKMDSDGKHHTGVVLMDADREGPSLEMMDSDEELKLQNALAGPSTEIEKID